MLYYIFIFNRAYIKEKNNYNNLITKLDLIINKNKYYLLFLI